MCERLHAEHRDEGLHRVVGEHAAAAALAGAGVQRDAGARLGVGIAGELEAVHEVDAFAGDADRLPGWIDPSESSTAGTLNSRIAASVPTGRLVARDDGDDAGDVVGAQVHVGGVVDEFAADQRVAHPLGAVELAVGHAQRERRRDQPNRQVVAADALRHRLVHRVDLLLHAEVALAVAEGAEHRPHRIVDLLDALAEEAGRADALHVAARVVRHESIRHAHSQREQR